MAGAGRVINGFIEGLVRRNTTPFQVLPFADKIGTAAFNYSSESTIVETFAASGVRGPSGACPFREECSITLGSENLEWSFLQACFNTLAEDDDQIAGRSISTVLSTSAGDPAVSTLILNFEVSASVPVQVADEDGVQYTITTVIGTGITTITFDADYTGDKVTVFYGLPPVGTNNLIKVGSGAKLGEIGLYGQFKGCPSNLLVVVPRAIIQSTVAMETGSGAASASLTATAMRDSFGNYAYLTRL
jgi:hypothetical protein